LGVCQHLFSPFFHFGSFVAFSPFYGFLLGILYMLSFCFRSPVLFFETLFFFLTVSGLGFSFCSASSSPPPRWGGGLLRGLRPRTPGRLGASPPCPPWLRLEVHLGDFVPCHLIGTGGDWGLRCTARPLCFTSFSISPPRGESPLLRSYRSAFVFRFFDRLRGTAAAVPLLIYSA
jgi:hypothetical protein